MLNDYYDEIEPMLKCSECLRESTKSQWDAISKIYYTTYYTNIDGALSSGSYTCTYKCPICGSICGLEDILNYSEIR